jgi:hypothetical protein
MNRNEASDRKYRTMTPMPPTQPEPFANSICLRRKDPLIVPPKNSDGRIAIRVSDWRRIKAKLSRAAKLAPDFSGVYNVLFGISGSALLSLVPLAVARGLPAWVTLLYLCFFVSSLLCALVLVWANKDVRRSRRSSVAEILADIKEIDQTFEPAKQ